MGNQLYDPQWLPEPDQTTVLMVEDRRLSTRHQYHQQKLGFVFSAMREHAQVLRSKGFNVVYHDLAAKKSLCQQTVVLAQQLDVAEIVAFTPANAGQHRYLTITGQKAARPLRMLEDPMFLTSLEDLDCLKSANPRMAHFYQAQRKRLNLLMAGEKPLGGKWSFDTDNRKAVPAHVDLPQLPRTEHSEITRQALDCVAHTFCSHQGNARELWIPTTREGAHQHLQAFVEERLVGFGTYEDAISRRSATLFHSVLSPYLNIGLLTPHDVVSTVMDYALQHDVPMNDIEGFVRQVIGWREFMRGIYLHHRKGMRGGNIWNAQRRMGRSWDNASTGIPPLDGALKNTQRYAWNHHTERLMVIANMMNLCEIRPTDAYEFFSNNYLDAYDWVMVPNLFGMGLTSDGGTFASKPYICGSNYMLRMSDYLKGEWCDVVDGLFWRFVEKHQALLRCNARASFMVQGLGRMKPDRRQRILSKADQFLDQHTLS